VYDYYDLLGVDRDAEPETIQAAFRERMRELHPDRGEDEAATEEVVRLQRAREVLTDPALRKDYDRLGHREFLARERQASQEDVELRSTGNEPTDTRSRSRTGTQGGADRSRGGTGRTDDSGVQSDRPRTDRSTIDDRAQASADDDASSSTPDQESLDAIDFGSGGTDDPSDRGNQQNSSTPPTTGDGHDDGSREIDESGQPGPHGGSRPQKEPDDVVDLGELLDDTNVGSVDPDEVLSDSDPDDPLGADLGSQESPDANDDRNRSDDRRQDVDPNGDDTGRRDSEPAIEFGESTTDRTDTNSPNDHANGNAPTTDRQPPSNPNTRQHAPREVDDRSQEPPGDETYDDRPDHEMTQPTDDNVDTTNHGDTDRHDPRMNDEPQQQRGDPLAGPSGDASSSDGFPDAGEASGSDGFPDAGEASSSDGFPDAGETSSSDGFPDAGETSSSDEFTGAGETSGASSPEGFPGAGDSTDSGSFSEAGGSGSGSSMSGMDEEPMGTGGGTAGGTTTGDSTASGDPLAGMGGGMAADSEADSEYAGTDGGVETAATGGIAGGGTTGSADSGGGIVATILSAPAALVAWLVALPRAAVARLVALPYAIVAAIPTFGIPEAIGESRLVFGSDWYGDEVAVMARYAWLGRLLLAAVAWPLVAFGLPGATLVPSASTGTLGALVIVLVLSHLGYDLLLSVGAELEPGCHGGAKIDPPLRGLGALVGAYLVGAGLAGGALWRADSLAAPLTGDRAIGALPGAVIDTPEPAVAATIGALLVVVSLLGLLSAALTLPWSDRYDRHYHVLPGLWQVPLSLAVVVLGWSGLTGGSVSLAGVELGILHLGAGTAALPIVAALYLVRRRLESPNPQPAW